MKTTTRSDDDLIAWNDLDDDRPRGCQWDEAVCIESPTRRIAPPHDSAHHVDAEVYCARHYALTLARLVMVHAPGCTQPLDAHVQLDEGTPV